jgi:hypothetical protein
MLGSLRLHVDRRHHHHHSILVLPRQDKHSQTQVKNSTQSSSISLPRARARYSTLGIAFLVHTDAAIKTFVASAESPHEACANRARNRLREVCLFELMSVLAIIRLVDHHKRRATIHRRFFKRRAFLHKQSSSPSALELFQRRQELEDVVLVMLLGDVPRVVIASFLLSFVLAFIRG